MNTFVNLWRKFHAPPAARSSRFIDLAPTRNADETGIYYEALNFATTNDEVLNIALTGPYGSGKSSVIKSFLSKYEKSHLQLSLASFLPDGELPGVEVTKQEIERSILQQMLYGADANRLPLSRFKRIQTPGRWSWVASIFVSVALVCVWYLLNKQPDLLSGVYFEPLKLSNWFNFACLFVAAYFAWRVVHNIYLKSLGLSLKSVSLKDIQIAPHAVDEESILNRHLDEIIYFFQTTDYELVVIEDLDRFENPEIFVTLREINGLINGNGGIHRKIRFLYALRDDIFVNTDRTKFFEFIVPVIPIINHSNSIDKVLQHAERIKLDPRIERGFLRDVSRYLSDLRLIANIFNEYVIYSSNLKADPHSALSPTKLLAVLIYKNVIPKDFAALHRQEGALSNVLRKYDHYISKVEGQIRSELSLIQAERERAEAHVVKDQNELSKIYAMAVIEKISSAYPSLLIGNAQVYLGQLAQNPELDKIVARGSVTGLHSSGARNTLTFENVEAAVDPTRTLAERRDEIDRKSSKFLEGLSKRAAELRGQLSSLRTRKFHEVVRESAALIDEDFKEVEDSKDLLKFLILEGHLDDTYYQYTSLFHSGRLSPNDNKFLIQIRGYSNPDPDFQIDTAAEVVASMRDEDFGHNYVLNRFIVDHLLADRENNAARIAAAIHFVATHFDECQSFFESYYERGVHVDRLVSALVQGWPRFTETSLDSPNGSAHAARILAYAPSSSLERSEVRQSLSNYLSLHTGAVFAEGVDFDRDRLEALQLQIADLPAIAAYSGIVSVIVEGGLYQINEPNIRDVLKQLTEGRPATIDLQTRHFSTVLGAGDDTLLARIRSDFATYVRDVLLRLEGNTAEDPAAIIEVLRREDVPRDLREEFFRRQTATFPSFENIPNSFHTFMLEQQKIEASWENCAAFLASEGYSKDVLTAYLQAPGTAEVLAHLSIPDGFVGSGLGKFVIENDALPDATYRSYARMLPRGVEAFPEVGVSKLKILIDERKVDFSTRNVEQLGDEDLQVAFIAANFAEYGADADRMAITDAFRRKLLLTNLSDAQKMKVIADIDPAFVSTDAVVASMIGPIMNRSSIDATAYSPEFVRSVIKYTMSPDTKVSLLNKLHGHLSAEEVREVLRDMPDPYSEIAVYHRFPRIDDNEANRQLASWLKERNLISSYTITYFDKIRINTFRKEA